MKKILKLLMGLSLLAVVVYTLLPEPAFPAPPPNAVQSMEEADTETPLKRAYFTNYTREQVIDHYKDHFRLRPLTLELNYPPEEAQTIIRDQTRSTYLEELAHPLRESLYINGFVPRVPKDEIWYNGVHYEEKITIKYVPSSVFVRVPVAVISLLSFFFVVKQFFKKNK